MRKLLFLPLCLFLAGCWQSDADLYAGETPVTPFKPGSITTISTDNAETSHQQLSLDGTTYRLSDDKDASVMLMRLYPLPGAPAYLVVDVLGVASCALATCGKGPHSYAVLHPLADGRVEELAQNCEDDAMAQKIGAVRKGFVCEFQGRATLEKALRTLVPMKPAAVISPQ